MESEYSETMKAEYTEFLVSEMVIPVHVEVKGFGKVRKATAYRTLGNSPSSDPLFSENLNRKRSSSDEIKDEDTEKRMQDFSKFADKLGVEAEKRAEVAMKRMEELNKKSEALAAVAPKKYRSKKERKEARKEARKGQKGSS